MFDVRRLRVFGEVVRAGSSSAAAATFSYTTSAVSQQITVLEREIGATLLVRGPTGVKVTQAGERLYEHATVIMAAIAAAERDVAAVASGNPARLRVASFASAAASVLPRPVARLRSAFPHVEVELIAADPDDGVALLGSGGADVAVVTEVPGERSPFPDVVSVPVFDDEFLVVLPVDHRLAGAPEVPFRSLAREQWILSSATERCPDSRAFRAACAHAGFKPTVSSGRRSTRRCRAWSRPGWVSRSSPRSPWQVRAPMSRSAESPAADRCAGSVSRSPRRRNAVRPQALSLRWCRARAAGSREVSTALAQLLHTPRILLDTGGPPGRPMARLNPFVFYRKGTGHDSCRSRDAAAADHHSASPDGRGYRCRADRFDLGPA